MTNSIYIFGASCSGKSTLSQALQKNLGSNWTYIDRDDLIDQGVCTESTANDTLDKRVQQTGTRFIIDAQIPWRKKREGELYFLVLPPLKTLLERDDRRTLKLQRTTERAFRAKQFVKDTHGELSRMEKTEFNDCFDSSQISVQGEIDSIKTFIDLKPEFNLHLQDHKTKEQGSGSFSSSSSSSTMSCDSLSVN